MKKIFLILCILILSFSVKGQYLNRQSIGSATTENYALGSYGTSAGFRFINQFPDTASANVYSVNIKAISNFLIIVDDTLYKRSYTANKWVKIGGSSATGTVTSVGALSPLFTTANATTTPTFSLISQSANKFFASPNGSSGVGSFRSIVAADLPSLSSSYWSLTGNSGTTAGTNYVGTSDNVNFQVRTNGALHGLFNSSLNSTAFGSLSTASGSSSFAGGVGTATGTGATAIGTQVSASAQAATAFGGNTSASGIGSFASGTATYMNSEWGTVLGGYNDTTGYYLHNPSVYASTDVIFALGSGNNTPTRANALQIKRNGAVSFGANGYGTANQVLISNGNAAPPSWIPQSSLTANNIYNSDGVLTGARLLDGDAHSLGLSNLAGFSVATSTSLIMSSSDSIELSATKYRVDNLSSGATTDSIVTYNQSTKLLHKVPQSSIVGAVPPLGTNRIGYGIGNKLHGSDSLTYTQSSNNFNMGFGNTLSGTNSFVSGVLNTTSGNYPVSFGGSNTSSGDFSASFGEANISSGAKSYSFGENNTNNADYSIVMGDRDTAFTTATVSFAAGANVNLYGVNSFGLGEFIKSKSRGGTVIGSYNDSANAASSTVYNTSNRAFQIGIGNADNARANAMTVLFNGSVGIGTVTPSALLDVVGGDAHVSGKGSFVSGRIFIQQNVDDDEVAIRYNEDGNIIAGYFPGLDYYTYGNNALKVNTGSKIQFSNYGSGTITGTPTKALNVDASGNVIEGTLSSSGLTVGTTTIASGTTGRGLYDNGGVLGEFTNTGTGTVQVLQNSPTLITPVIGAATGTSLTLTNTGLTISAVGGNGFRTSGGGFFIFKSDGVATLSDNSDASWGRLQFGGTTSSYPALKRSTTSLQVRLADDSGDGGFSTGALTATGTLSITDGANKSVGVATLVGGTVTVSNTRVTASSRIFLTDATTGSLVNIGTPTVGTIVAGTSFVINSSNALDASNINWLIIN